MKKQFKTFVAVAVLCVAWAGTHRAGHAQDAAPVVKSMAIVEALESKDIVLDGARPPTRPSANAPRRPRAGAVDLQIQFAFDSADLLPAGRQQLDELAQAFGTGDLRTAGFELMGHTDRSGDAVYNQRLSLERAVAARNYLTTVHGIAPARLATAGLGYSDLADPGNPGGAINRRVEIRLLAAAGIAPPAAMPTTDAPRPGGRLVRTPQ